MHSCRQIITHSDTCSPPKTRHSSRPPHVSGQEEAVRPVRQYSRQEYIVQHCRDAQHRRRRPWRTGPWLRASSKPAFRFASLSATPALPFVDKVCVCEPHPQSSQHDTHPTSDLHSSCVGYRIRISADAAQSLQRLLPRYPDWKEDSSMIPVSNSMVICILQLFDRTHPEKAARTLDTTLHHRLGSETHVLLIRPDS